MNRRLVFCGAMAAVLMISAGASGQNEQKARTYNMAGRGMTVAYLLRNEVVKKEIGITQKQAAKLEEVLRYRRLVPGQFRQMPEKEREEAIAKYAKRAAKREKKIAEILDDKQEKRLEELRIQAMEPYALMDERITKKLLVTDQQKQEMAKVRDGIFEKMRTFMASGNRPSREGMERMRQNVGEALRKILTEEQTAKYEKMKGKPFDMSQLRSVRDSQSRDG